MLTKRNLLISAITGSVLFGLGTNHQAWAQDSTDPIRLAVNDWTGAQITTQITGKALSELGYKIDYVSAGYIPQFTALTDGEITVAMEIWSSSIGETWPKSKQTGKVVSLGPLGLVPAEGWMYPKHMEEICPGLPDWKALQKPACIEKLTTPESFPKGRILDYPADWGSTTKAVLKDFKLPYVAQPGGSEGALVTEFNASVAKKSPLVLMFWSPHWVTAEHEVGWVQFPDGAEGPVFPKNDIFKVAWVGAKGKWPRAMAFIEKIRLNNKEYGSMIKSVDVGKKKLEDVTKAWVDENKDRWMQWWKATEN